MEKKNPFKTVWDLLNIPLSLLGFLSLSDSLIKFHQDIQNLIDSYHTIVYPVFNCLFAWAWFEVPSYVFDYLFIGTLYTSSEAKTRGLGTIQRTSDGKTISLAVVLSSAEIRTVGVPSTIRILLNIALLRIPRIAMSILMCPFRMLAMAWHISMTNDQGMIKGTTIQVRYLRREGDIFVFRYLGALIVLFVVILIINYSLFMAT